MNKQRIGEILRFACTGAGCFAVELACLTLCKEVFRLDTLIATPIAFLVSVAVNYLLCVVWVFKTDRNTGVGVKAGFLLTSVVGLLLNELIMLLLRSITNEEQVLLTVFAFPVSMYMLNKTIATLLVTIWNYLAKRKLLARSGK